MSKWTHCLGVVRYDSYSESKYEKIKELNLIKKVWSKDLPEGSEQPIQVNFCNTNRGPTVFITGDLRDRGENELNNILKWANICHKSVKDIATKEKLILFIRDSFINCDVEFNNKKFIIEFDEDLQRFIIKIFHF